MNTCKTYKNNTEQFENHSYLFVLTKASINVIIKIIVTTIIKLMIIDNKNFYILKHQKIAIHACQFFAGFDKFCTVDLRPQPPVLRWLILDSQTAALDHFASSKEI